MRGTNLDEIMRMIMRPVNLPTVRPEREKSAVEKAISDCYSWLTAEEAEEQSLWGDFAAREFPNQPA
jgi:hypothetical protein